VKFPANVQHFTPVTCTCKTILQLTAFAKKKKYEPQNTAEALLVNAKCDLLNPVPAKHSMLPLGTDLMLVARKPVGQMVAREIFFYFDAERNLAKDGEH
jgi:hypothetical protein